MRWRERWHRFHRRPAVVRWPVKLGLFALVLAGVLYPRFWLVPRWLGRLADMNAVLEPAHPGLEGLAAEARDQAGPAAPLAELAQSVERAVRARVPYAYDWETWGVMDYLPTVGEVLALGREDCDGQAVIAASLLRRLGYEAWMVGDIKHTWVAVRDPAAPEAVPVELMSPGRGAKALIGTETGTRPVLSLDALASAGRALPFGVAVFPLGREVIVLVALCALTMQPRSSRARRAAGCGLLAAALALLRLAGASAAGLAERPVLVWLGVAAAVAGWLLLAVKAGASGWPPGPPGSRAAAGSGRG